VTTYNIGPLTAQYVFGFNSGLTNMSDMQAVMDAVEAALEKREGIIGEAYQMFGQSDIFDTPAAQKLLDLLAEIKS